MPCAPVSPFAPCAPVSPLAPAGPAAPCAPVSRWPPAVPAAPAAPVSPFAPAVPAAPCGPVAPAVPAAPAAPCAPVSPFAPAAPSWPLSPFAPDPPLSPRTFQTTFFSPFLHFLEIRTTPVFLLTQALIVGFLVALAVDPPSARLAQINAAPRKASRTFPLRIICHPFHQSFGSAQTASRARALHCARLQRDLFPS